MEAESGDREGLPDFSGGPKGSSKGGHGRRHAKGSPREGFPVDDASSAKGGSKGSSKGGRGRWRADSPAEGFSAENAFDAKGGSGVGSRHNLRLSQHAGDEACIDVPREHACGHWSWSDHRSRRPPRGSPGRRSKRPCKWGADCRRKDDEEHCMEFFHPEPEDEKRIAGDGKSYTRAEFQEHYRDSWQRKWDVASPDKAEKPSSGRVCSFFARGVCTRGDRCKFLHEQPEEKALDGAMIGGTIQGGNAHAEVLEEVLAESSGVRAVYGHGGEVTSILFPDECISVVVRAQAGINEDDLRAQLSKYGELRSLSFESKGKGKGSVGAKGGKSDKGEDISKSKGDGKGCDALVAHATFVCKTSAATLLAEWRSQAGLLGVQAGGVQPPRPTQPMTGFLIVKWNVGDEFENISDDEDGFDSDPTTWNCTACTFANTGGALSCAACEGSCPRRVTRRALDEALKMCVPLLHEATELEPFYVVTEHRDRKFHNRGFRVHYPGGAEEVQRALRAWQPAPAHPHLTGGPPVTSGMRSSLWCRGEFFAAVRVDQALFEWWSKQEPDLLKVALDAANKNSIKATVSRKTRGSIVITFRGASVSQLQDARGQLLEVIASDVFSHPRKDILFSAPARRRLDGFPFYVQTQFRTRTVRVFGTPDARRNAEAALAALLTELGNVSRMDFVLRARGLDCTKLKADLELAEDPELRGRNLTLWVPAGREDACREHMEPWVRKATTVDDEAMCALCFCEFDDSRHQLLGCGHTFCTGCLENCLREPSSSHFPLLCQGPSPVVAAEALPCKQPICWADLVRLAPPESLAAIKAIAVQTYLLENPGEGVYCGGITGSGCNALVRPEDGQVACAQCGEAYCVNCSSLLKKVVDLHPTTTCEQAQLEARLGVQEHRRRIIDEFLTLRCPKCATAFEDFTACAALTCSSCNIGFCAKCFKNCGTSSEDTHAHVYSCTGEEGLKADPGYFITLEVWHKNNLRRAQSQVKKYLRGLEPELRVAVIHACESDFAGRPGGDLVVPPELMAESAEVAAKLRSRPAVKPKPKPKWR